MSRWVIIDSTTKEMKNIIVAETFEIANTATFPEETPIPYLDSMGFISPGQVYDESNQKFINPGSENAEV